LIMADNFTDTIDGDGRYASRVRVNRKVIEFDGLASANNESKTVFLNGKIGRIIIDPSRCTSTSTTATSGSLSILMDIEDAAGNQYTYCDSLEDLDFRDASNTPLHFQTSEGGNMNADGGATSGLHFTVTAPGSSKAGTVTIDEPAAWNGLVCGQVTFKVATSAGTFDSDTGSLRLTVLFE